jgi:hypothetical protein
LLTAGFANRTGPLYEKALAPARLPPAPDTLQTR